MSEAEPPTKKQKVDVDGGEETTIEENVAHKDFTLDVDMDDGANFTVSEDKYNNFVRPEELERLREFKVLDEVKSNDEDSNEEDSDSSDGKSDGVPEDEIEKMLEEDLPEDFKGAPKPKEKPYITRQKVVLEEKGVNHFEVLPLDWMMVRHYSGMPVYMHRTSRVCTLSKPYFLGKGNTRRHDIPISAIPCLAYRRALEEEKKQKEIDQQIEEQIRSGTWQQNDKSKNIANNKGDVGSKTDDEVQKSSEITLKCPFKHGKRVDQVINIEAMKENAIISSTQESREESTSVHLHTVEDQSSVSEKEVDKSNEEDIIETYKNHHTEPDNIDKTVDDQHKTKEDVPSENNDKAEVIEANNETNNVLSEINENKTNDDAKTNDSQTNEVETNEGQDKTNEEAEKEIPLNRQPVVLPGGIVMPPPRVETVSTSWKTQHLTHEQVNNYCKKLFRFKTVNIMHFKRWADRRKYTKARKTLQYPTLPEGTKLITIPAQPTASQENGGGKSNKRDWVMNMNGRSYLSVFHEYVRRALQKQPVYEFKQLENASTPYQATVYIGGMQYGVGHGSSKRSAKSAAARASIHILIPEMRADLDHAPQDNANEPDFSFFDYVGIEDPRITEFCAATCEPSPHAILRTCLLRNFGAGDKHIHTEMKKLEYQKIELTMKVGKHTATVVCKNKKTAKQRASQAILQALHPHVRSWGSLLRLYGSRSVKSCKEKKLEEQQITLLQDAARHNEPNYAVLEKLRHEMKKLRERDEAVVPIGTLVVKDDLPTHSGSNLNNVDL
ncbi:microprocessor complex subunit DGCR8 [Pectinophora gossypiella]|uniref:microprocessor complex subunit DGCR8 n=1 Tax=Pectinophora gossypiella TaxID=13191 RepID=UPI00214EE213|nr:microprocessor complex subunit DGCR8 [Pectinophora gossypiella]XP_049878888.1 microprocessor complex subunit DGCR8 [Pectinophora gossypiella]XP_049878890.1 microprocessor complex subunit DGCR8 [Pectinophora gossypiella]XP_049878891.1 microprocessor complex subunit DGCR8 [Pectinophora gossypiella]